MSGRSIKYAATIFVLLALCMPNMTVAQGFKKTATSGFVFLELPVNARNAAMGEAAVAMADIGADGVFLNPAAVGFMKERYTFSASYSPWIAETKHYASAFAFETPLGFFAVSAIVFDYGTMRKTIRSTTPNKLFDDLGTFSASDVAFGITYAKMLTDQFSFGVTTKYVREGIDSYSASNVLFDGGVLYHTGLGALRLGAALQNFGTDAQFKSDPFRMPIALRLGLATEVLEEGSEGFRITTAAEALHPSDGDEKVNVGVEVGYMNLLAARGGYKFFTDEESYSFGLGVSPQQAVPVAVDFSFADYGRLGTMLRFTVHVHFK